MHKIIPPIKPDMQGKDVANLLEALQFLLEKNILGLSEREKINLQEHLPGEINEHYYGKITVELVQIFQKKYDLITRINRGKVDVQTAQKLNSVLKEFGALEEPTKKEQYHIQGRVFSPTNMAVGSLQVKVWQRGLSASDQPLAQGVTNRFGAYHLTFDKPPSKGRLGDILPDVQVEILSDNTSVAMSKIYYDVSESTTIDMVIDELNSFKLQNEFDSLSDIISEYVDIEKELANLKEDEEYQQITYLANKIGWDARLVAMRVLAEKYHKKSAVLSSLFYALFRAGFPSELEKLYLIDHKVLVEAWKEAIEKNIISKGDEEGFTEALKKFAEEFVDNDQLVGFSSVKSLLKLALPERQQQREFIRLYRDNYENIEVFWQQVKKEFDKNEDDKTKDLQLYMKLSNLTLNNVSLIEKLPAISDPIELIEKGFYKPKKWEELFEGITLPEEINEKNYAEYLAACLKLAYPIELARVTMGEFELENKDLNEAVNDFLTTHQNQFHIAMQPVDSFVQENELIISDDVKNEIRRIQEFYRLKQLYSPMYLKMAPKFIKGIHSSPYYLFDFKVEEKVISDVAITPFKQLVSGGRLVVELNHKMPFVFGYTKIQVQGNERTENITGAFGLQLGDVFNPKDAINSSKTERGEVVYQFEPTKKVKCFKTYYLIITPISHKIIKIWGIGDYENIQTCQDNMDVIQTILEKKYGKMDGNSSSFGDSEIFVLDQKKISLSSGARYISLKYTNNIQSLDLYLEYKDNDLYELSVEEREKLKFTDIDSSAL